MTIDVFVCAAADYQDVTQKASCVLKYILEYLKLLRF